MLDGDMHAMARYWPGVNINTPIRCSRVWSNGPCGWSGSYRDTLVGYAHWFGYYQKPQPRLLVCPRCHKGRDVDSYYSTVLVNLLQTHLDQYCEPVPVHARDTEQFSSLPVYGSPVAESAIPP